MLADVGARCVEECDGGADEALPGAHPPRREDGFGVSGHDIAGNHQRDRLPADQPP